MQLLISLSVRYDAPRFGQKALEDIASIEDIFSWMRVGIMPRLWADEQTYSEVKMNAWYRCREKRSEAEALASLGQGDAPKASLNVASLNPGGLIKHCSI